MNLQSWLILILILVICAAIVYNRYIKDTGEVGCKDCPGHNPEKGFDKGRIKNNK